MLSETTKFLIQRYDALTLTPEQLAEVLHYGSAKTVLNAISGDRFPVRTFKAGKFRLARVEDVAAFIDSHGEKRSA